ncbi:MAG TPA: hypothetical protein VF648_09160 [Pyrinomonadaceae bacterium]
MQEINTLELEQFRKHLEYCEDKTLRNLNPFFKVKMFELKFSVSPSVIILQAFPDAKPEKAQIIERSENEFSDGVIDFFSQLESTSQENQFKIAYEFLETLKSVIKLEHSKIWEYLPDHSSFDRLYDYIGWGFTYIIVEESNRQCLIIHGGYID